MNLNQHYSKTDRALVDLVISQTRPSALVNILVILIVGVLIWPAFDNAEVGSWVFCGIVLALFRILLFPKIVNHERLRNNYLARELIAAIALIIVGLHWGMAAWLFLDPAGATVHSYILSATLLGMASGMLATASARPNLWLAFVMAEFSIVAYKFIMLGHISLGLMTILFTFGFYFVAKSLGKHIETSIKHGYENDELLKEVSLAKDLAEKANIQKSQFMAATSHDLRQPLHAQGLLLEALRGQDLEPTQSRLVNKLVQSSGALETLFESLLEISQLDAGTVSVNASHQFAHKICYQVIGNFELLAADKNLHLELKGDDCVVFTDPILLGRVLSNLVSNAIKYTERGTIAIEVAPQDDSITIAVQDSGIGIAPELHEAIFNEYMQLNNSARDRNKGVGLGLALVRRMCKLLNYDISVVSAPEQGSRFTLTLPKGDERQIITVDAHTEPSKIKGLNIILVDDELTILDAMKELLSQWECQCHGFTTLEEAKAELQKKSFSVDVIISDYRLKSGITGIECIQSLRQLTGLDTPAVLLSGDTDPALLKQVQDKGYYMLHKPLKPAKLRNVMSLLLSA